MHYKFALMEKSNNLKVHYQSPSVYDAIIEITADEWAIFSRTEMGKFLFVQNLSQASQASWGLSHLKTFWGFSEDFPLRTSNWSAPCPPLRSIFDIIMQFAFFSSSIMNVNSIESEAAHLINFFSPVKDLISFIARESWKIHFTPQSTC